MNANLENKLKTLPRSPGVYFHKSSNGEIIYIGKAAVLKNRVRQYFQSSRNFDVKTLALVKEIHDTDWVETESEIDALFLESEMVKRYKPRFNILLRDDKSQLFVRIDMKSEWPHVSFTRNPADDKAEYFGPFYNGHALKKAIRYLRPIYPYFTKPPANRTSRLDEDLGLSPKKSEGSELYKQNLRKLVSYIKGNRVALMRELEQAMKHAAKQQEFEQAAVLRNKYQAMRELQRRVMFGDREFLDISKDRALNDLQMLLGIETSLARIEGYDISHQSGKDVVASMVVFTNGVSDRAEYRKFKVKQQQNDDTASMYETIYRRFSEKNVKSWGMPGLLLIDGGKGQLSAAIRALSERELAVPVVSIAKREEEMVIHNTDSNISLRALELLQKNPVPGVGVFAEGNYVIVNLHLGQRNASGHSRNLGSGVSVSPYSDVIKLFQRIRDESHRFAISYHTQLKKRRQTKSILEDVPGIGPATRRQLLRSFGSLKAVQEATEEDLAAQIGPKKARILKTFI